jgi:hypothetical protein
MLLYAKKHDLYYDPSRATSIRFFTFQRRDNLGQPFPNCGPEPRACLMWQSDETIQGLTDPDAIAELRQWCDKQVEEE